MAVTIAEFAAKLGLETDTEGFERGEKLIEGIKSKIELFIGAEAIKKVGEMVEGTVNAAVGVKRLAEETGTSTDAIQELGYAAKLNGAEAETMNIAFRHLAVGMQETRRTGTGPFADALQQLGVHFSAIKDKSPDVVLQVLADKLSKLPDGFKKTALTAQLFGERSGPQLIPLMNRGSAGISAMRMEAEKLGAVMGGEAIENAEDFEHASAKLGATLTGIKNRAIAELLPELEGLVTGITEWVSENHELVESLVGGVVTALEYVGAAAGKVIEVFGAVVAFLQEHTDIATAIIIGLGATIAAFAAAAAIDWAIAFAPIITAIAIIGGLALGIKKLGELIAGEELSWEELWENIVDDGEAALAWFESLPGRVVDFFGEIRDDIVQAFSDAWDAVVQGAHDAWQKIKDTPVIGHIIRGAQAVGGAVSDLVSSPDTSSGPSPFDIVQQYSRGGAGSVTVTGGDTHVTVQATTNASADEIGRIVGEHVDAKNKDMLRKAAAAFGSGA